MNSTNVAPAELLIPLLEDTSPDRRPVVLIPGQHTDDVGGIERVGNHEFSAAVLTALPPTALFRMDKIVGELIGPPGERVFSEVDEHRLRSIIDAHVFLARWVKRKQADAPSRVYVSCTRDWAAIVLAFAAASQCVPELKTLTRYPVYAPGADLARPGWSPDSGIFYDEPLDLVGLVPATDPSIAVLDDVLIDFPFADEASKHNAIGFMVLIVARPMIPGNIPFHVLTAPLERTGKGLLIETCAGRIVLGGDVPTMQPGRSEEEIEKRISALILKGATVVHFDNIPAEEMLDSAALASLVTTRLWMGRVLGRTFVPALGNTIIPILSGNNLTASGELTKRMVPIKLQPTTSSPEQRTDFQHTNIREYAASRRRDVLEHLLGFVEKWKREGRVGAKRVMGGFEEFVQIVGGICAVAGATAWMTNYRTWVASGDEFASDAEILLAHWAQQKLDEELTARQILELVNSTGTFPFVASRKPEGQLVSLGKAVLKKLENRPVGNWIVRSRGSGSTKFYRLDAIRQP